MRINRFLARSGVASRRASEELIRAGRVTLNGRLLTELATEVDPDSDVVEVDGQQVNLPESYTYIMLNKPRDTVVTMSDPQGRRTVADLTAGAGARVVPVGRLDTDTEGLLILTDDGDLAHRVSHPSFELDKVYVVEARGVLSDSDRGRLEEGIMLDGRPTSPARVEVLSTDHDVTRAKITIHEGRKRQVRRMFEAVGHPVKSLVRTRVGPVALGELPPGKWRRLSAEELTKLREAVSGRQR